MRYFYIILLLTIQNTLFSQTFFSINGHIFHQEKKVNITNCIIVLTSSSGAIWQTSSDSLGYYSFDSLKNNNDNYLVTVTKKGFFGAKSKIQFNGTSHDTIIDIQIGFGVIDYYWMPDILFCKNSSTPEKQQQDKLSAIVRILDENPNANMKVIGHKDSLEKKDKRKERAYFIFGELVQLGISKDRLKTEISDKPTKFYTSEKDYNTGERIFSTYSESYISMLPYRQQKKIRHLNDCVSFEIFYD